MKAKVTFTPGPYGFGKNWTLEVTSDSGDKKAFWLGQDAKVCSRIIGARPHDVVRHIGGPEIESNEQINQNLAYLILESIFGSMADAEENVFKAEAFDLAAE